VDAQADLPPPISAPAGPQDAAAATVMFDARAPRPAPANWRGCGFRRVHATRSGGRAAWDAAAV